ncbi:MAG TPA: alpha/beta fold hydrolase [Stellaceae bacterium]
MLLPYQGRRLYYDLAGPENGPVVCITHSLASDSGMWGEQMQPLLAAGFRVLRVDMRGHGGSDPVAGDYTMEQLAGDTAAVVDALGIKQVHYIGLSIGGMIGQAFALAHGAMLKSMMLCDTMPQTPPDAKAAWGPRVKMVREANSVTPLADGTMERWFTEAFKPRNPGRWKQIRDTIAATTPAGYLGCAAAIQNFDFVPRLPSIKTPTLVVCGAEDPGTPPAGNKRIAELIPSGRYEEIAKARHFPNVEQAEVFNRIMMAWLTSQR